MKRRVGIRCLNSEDDKIDLQTVLEAAPRYAFNVSGGVQPPAAAENVFSSLPDGFSSANKFVYGIELDSMLIGCMDLLRGYPKPDTVMLGLLLLQESHQGKGFGRESFFMMENLLQEWPEIKKIRICVVESNGEVLGFWKKLGFADTGFRRPYESGSFTSQAIVLQKLL